MPSLLAQSQDSLLHDKLSLLKKNVVQSFKRQVSLKNKGEGEVGESVSHHGIDYDTFLSLLREARLPELGNRKVFSIFDSGNSGACVTNRRSLRCLCVYPYLYMACSLWACIVSDFMCIFFFAGLVDMKDFLLTMIAFKLDDEPANSQAAGQSKAAIDDQCALYFNLFDIDDTGYIDLEELKLMVQILLRDQQPATAEGMQKKCEELFKVIDSDANGNISFDEFKKFYAGVLTC